MLGLPIHLLILVALCIGAAAAAVWSLGSAGREGLKARLDSITKEAAPSAAVSVMTDEGPKTFWERIVFALGRGQASGADTGQRRTLRTTLVHAGFRRPTALAFALGVRVALMIAAPLLLAPIVFAKFGARPALALLFLAIAVGTAYVLPTFLLGGMATRRKQRIDGALSDVLDLLVLCVEAGLGLNAAISRVAEERAGNRDPLGEELGQLANELRLGVPRKDALRSLAARTGSDDLRAVVAHLVQTERLGGNLGPALRAQSDMVRMSRRLRAEETANKMPLKMLLPMVCFMPALFIVIIVPVALRLVAAMSGTNALP
jgi:tight adherence protein C